MNRFRVLRNERGLSLRGLEIKTGINYSSLAKFENETREPGLDDLKTLANFFQVSIDYMICFKAYDIFVLDEESNILFKINEELYSYLKDKDSIYYNNDKRCINFNKIIGGDDVHNVGALLFELCRINNIDKVFDKNDSKLDDFNMAFNVDDPIEFNFESIEKLNDIIKKAGLN